MGNRRRLGLTTERGTALRATMRVCLAARSLARGTNALLATAAAMRPAARSVLMSSSAGVKPNISLDKSRNGLITIAPGEGAAHTATVIGPIHGLGDTNMGWADAALQLHTGSLGHVKFVLPNTPTAPVTLNGGMPMPSWYDITSLDDRANQECEGIESARELINSLIAAELSDGIPLHRIVVGGFSQGESPAHRRPSLWPFRPFITVGAGFCWLSAGAALTAAATLALTRRRRVPLCWPAVPWHARRRPRSLRVLAARPCFRALGRGEVDKRACMPRRH